MNMQKLLKQAREMQERMHRDLSETLADGSAGGGMVTTQMNGHKQLLSVKINPEAIDPEDPEMLEDMVLAAVNEVNDKMDEILLHKLGPSAKMPNLF